MLLLETPEDISELSSIYYSVGQKKGAQKRFVPGGYAFIRVNNCTLEILRKEESILSLIKSTTRFNTKENVVMEK